MATQVQTRRGTTAQNAAFLGVEGEITFDTQTKRLLTHDGVTLGGFAHALLSLAQTFTAKQTITPLVNTEALVVSGYSLTGANVQPLLSLAGTWNTTGTPAALLLDITDTASNANSLLVDLRVGASSKWKCDKTGKVTQTGVLLLPDGTAGAPAYGFSSSTHGFYRSGNSITVSILGAASASFGSSSALALLNNAASLLFGASSDTILVRDAANTLALRNATTAQTFNVYNTFTDASNYERGVFKFSSNVLTVGTEQAGTGAIRILRFMVGGTNRWDIISTGHWIATADNVLDIGASGSNRPRTGYFGTSLFVGATKVIGAQGAAVADASGGTVIDVEARAALNALLARIRTHGLIAT